MIKTMVEVMGMKLEESKYLTNSECNFLQTCIDTIQNCTGLTLTEVRNEIIEITSDKKTTARANGDWKEFDKYNNVMSKTVCLIDRIA